MMAKRFRSAALVLAVGLAPVAAQAQDLSGAGKTLTLADGEARQIETALQPPRKDKHSEQQHDRMLIDAELAYRLKNYEDASLILYDLVEEHPEARSLNDAIYYLADSLFYKGDYRSSQKYFQAANAKFGKAGHYYQQGLMRLVELSLKLHDDAGVADVLTALDAIPETTRDPAVPYVRGKYAYFTGDLDKAATLFDAIGAAHPYFFQARYFSGVVRVAQAKYGAAATAFAEILRAQPKTPEQGQVVELARLALGRVYYQTGKPTKAIEEYQKLDRKSPYFDEMLYEVAWTHVKAKQYDKALRAIDLLTLADPKTGILPDVQILEGNLRIRLGAKDSSEYTLADRVFNKAKGQFEKPKADLETLLKDHADPQAWFSTLVGHSGTTFEVQGTQPAGDMVVPPVATAFVKQKPDVQRVMALVGNMDTIRQDLFEAETLVQRLEATTSSANRVSIFPDLAKRRGRLYELKRKISETRASLGAEERGMSAKVASPAEQQELSQIAAQRTDLERQLAALPMASDPYEVRVAKSKALVEGVANRASEVNVQIQSLQAQLVALEKYQKDPNNKTTIKPEVFEKEVADIKTELATLTNTYESIRNELMAARDSAAAAGVGQEEANLRAQLQTLLNREHQLSQSLVSRLSGDDRSRASQIESLLALATQAEASITRADGKIDKILDGELADISKTLTEEKGHVVEYQQQLGAYEQEASQVGAGVVRDGFVEVAQDFYNIIVRADVGIIDVAWAQKEESSNSVARLNLQLGNERRVLREDFKEVLQSKSTDEQKEGGQ